MHKRAHCHDEAASHQLPVAAAFWIICIVSMEECSSLMQNAMQIHCSTRSVILNVMATQYTCSLNSFYHPHWLEQQSHHCSHMRIPVHSPWLPGYIDVDANCSCYINNDWTFSRQTSDICSLSLVPGTQLLKSLDSLEWQECLLYANEITYSWRFLDSFRMVTGHQKDYGMHD